MKDLSRKNCKTKNKKQRTFYFFATQPMASLGGFSVSSQMNSIPIFPFLNLVKPIPLISNSLSRCPVKTSRSFNWKS